MKKKDFDYLLGSMKEAVAIAGGSVKPAARHKVRVPETVDVKAIRAKLAMTQRDFSETFGFSLRSVASWEGGERTPEKAARILLHIIHRNPDVVLRYAR